MVNQLLALLVAIDHDFVEMGSAKLLRFDHQIILVSVVEEDLHLEKMSLLVRGSVNLSNMSGI